MIKKLLIRKLVHIIMNKYLKKSVLMVVTTASLVTVAGVANVGNNVANVAHAAYVAPQAKNNYNPNDPNQNGGNKNVPKQAQETLTNPNAKPSTMPILKQSNGKERRATLKYVYLDGIPCILSADGSISSIPSDGVPKAWLTQSGYAKHPELNILYNNKVNMVDMMLNGRGKKGNKNVDNFVNIPKLYREFYHININKLITNTRPSDWKTRYANGRNYKSYFVKGYKVPSNYKANTLAGLATRNKYFPTGNQFTPNYLNQLKNQLNKLDIYEDTKADGQYLN
ncbi:hypothetical protein [Lactobacillus sp. Sy-1]|uniref:hypothetical protein n=1 Tax=Lactobacillus sp. Sy-1 TaxID=2109645 RepID=UPI001C5A9556|nr:hypothetical protein [Lactobacillus sp. Sy-1]MBW1606453.1 hypothetical protein [Lactobacillus sp. Sy-1]